MLGERLPAITATHWSGGGLPDGFTSTSVFFAACLSLTVLGGLIGWAGFAWQRKPMALMGLLFAGGLAAWTGAGLFASCAVPTAAAGDPTQAVSGPWIFASIAASLIGLLPAWISGAFQQANRVSEARRRERIAAAQGRAAAPAPVRSGGPVLPGTSFERTMSGPWWLWAVGLLMLAIGIWTLVWDAADPSELLVARIWSAISILIVTPLLLGLARIRVRIDERGLRVSSAIFGFRLRRIAFDQIEGAVAETIEPMQWGGWGWRFFPGGSAVVMRRAEGIAVQLRDGRRFAVTIPDAEQAASELQARRA